MRNKNILSLINEFRVLIKSIPSVTFALFLIAVFCMNLMANKSINLPFNWLALDCGIVISWLVFIVLDMVTKHFGPKAATMLSVFATLINLFICFIFYIVSIIPGVWGESFVTDSEAINNALNNTFGGTWHIILASVVAFLISSFLNNFINFFVGKVFRSRPDSLMAYLSRSYISTAVAQFADNFVFALLISRAFFSWTIIECISCSLFGMLAELIIEAIFSPIGFKICEKWRKNNVGEEFLNYEGTHNRNE